MNPLVIKAIIGLVMVVGVGAAGWRVHEWRQAYHELPKVKQQLSLEETCGEGSKCEEKRAAVQRAAEKSSEKQRKEYEESLGKIASRPPRIVRVCNSTVPSSAGVDGGGAAGESDVLPGPTGQDIGPDLYALAREADRQLALRRALINWTKEVRDAGTYR